MKPTGITRVRNEELIRADTIRHYLQHCEHIILYDDASTDNTWHAALAAGGDRITVIQGHKWRTDRTAEETRHRRLLLDRARQRGAEWVLCFDADERLVGELPHLHAASCSGYTFRLFDGYLTDARRQDYTRGPLEDLPRMWGPEYRDILMLFRADRALYHGLDRREPVISGTTLRSGAMVKHYGKCLSVAHWEETCDYYARYFPKLYRDKWLARKGKAIHTRSDFGRELRRWSILMTDHYSWHPLK